MRMTSIGPLTTIVLLAESATPKCGAGSDVESRQWRHDGTVKPYLPNRESPRLGETSTAPAVAFGVQTSSFGPACGHEQSTRRGAHPTRTTAAM